MRHIVLIACCKRKQERKCPAWQLYQGDLFKKSLAFAKTKMPDAIYILSAKHGLVALHDELAPYEQTLNRMPVKERRHWTEQVLTQLRAVCDLDTDQFTILASKRYREGLVPFLRNVNVPMAGLQIGKQLSWLKKQLNGAR